MFILVQLKDTIRIPPEDASLLQKDILHLIRVEVNNKYANKILHDLGLCVLIHSILAYDEPQLYPGDSGPYIHCTFRVVIFQPVESEILHAKIVASDETKIILSLDFFDSIIVEPSQLPQNTSFNKEESVWVWNNDGTEYFYDTGVMVRFKVSSLKFAPPLTIAGPQNDINNANLTLSQQKALKYGYSVGDKQVMNNPHLAPPQGQENQQQQYAVPLTIVGSMQEAGLGPVEWWD